MEWICSKLASDLEGIIVLNYYLMLKNEYERRKKLLLNVENEYERRKKENEKDD